MRGVRSASVTLNSGLLSQRSVVSSASWRLMRFLRLLRKRVVRKFSWILLRGKAGRESFWKLRRELSWVRRRYSFSFDLICSIDASRATGLARRPASTGLVCADRMGNGDMLYSGVAAGVSEACALVSEACALCGVLQVLLRMTIGGRSEFGCWCCRRVYFLSISSNNYNRLRHGAVQCVCCVRPMCGYGGCKFEYKVSLRMSGGEKGEKGQGGVFDKEEERIFEIITGRLRYQGSDFREQDLQPDMIIRIALPTSQYIPRSDYLQLNNYVAFPSQQLERAFQRAERLILEDMARRRENTDPNNLKIRLQKAIRPADLRVKRTHYLNQYGEQEAMEVEAIHEHTGELDCFTLEFNAIVYLLQEVCGFRVRPFLLYDDRQEEKEIFLFLTLSTEGLVRLAKRYRIKKEIDYTFIDPFLNDPTDADHRPLRYTAPVKNDPVLLPQIKALNRYFRMGNSGHETTELVEEREVSDGELDNFRDYLEEIGEVFEYFKYRAVLEVGNREKAYLFEFNRRKINPGCERLFALVKQRAQFFEVNKQVLAKYGYHAHEQPLAYEEFHLPDKDAKTSFFEKLYSLLLYRPMVASPRGDLHLFRSMERTKLCYLAIKNHFKVSYLARMGFDFLALGSNFEKFGEGREGLEGEECLEESWRVEGLFTNMDAVRSYVGDRVGMQVLVTQELLMYFVVVLVPYAILYALEESLGDSIYLFTSTFETVLYAVTFRAFLVFWELSEQEYVKNYSDSVSSRVFLNEHRGPYRRNPLTDELNEFQAEGGWRGAAVNLACAGIILVLLVVMGAVFHGCRMLVVEIYEPLAGLVASMVSLPHLLAYLLFFLVVDLAAVVATDGLMALMVALQNPPTDEEQEEWRSTLSFFYLLGLQLIPPFFFFVLEPFAGTSCYANDCLSEIEYYIYARMIITFAVSACRLGHVFLFNYLRAKHFFRKRTPVLFEERLGALLGRAAKEARRKEHVVELNETIVLLASFSIYCNVLPIISVLALVAFFMQHTNTRLAVLYQERRPLNRSERVSLFSGKARTLFHVGMVLQAWVSVFLYEFVETNFQSIIKRVSTIVSYQGIFLFKLVCVFGYFLVLLFLSGLVAGLVQGFSSHAVLKRKDNKFREFVTSRGRIKQEFRKPAELVPLKAVFRAFSPDATPQEQLAGLLAGAGVGAAVAEEEPEQIDSLINITLKNLRE